MAPAMLPDVDLLAEARQGNMVTTVPKGTAWSDYIQQKSFTIQGDARNVLFMHPASSADFAVKVPANSELRFALGIDPAVWDKSGDGVDFQVVVILSKREVAFSRYVDPKHEPADRRWIDASVDLSPYAGRNIVVELGTSPHQSADYDWAGWATPKVARR
jgi:hypothetical protein